MDGFGYYKKILAGTFRASKPWSVIITAAAWALAFNGFRAVKPIALICGAACGVVFWLLWMMIGALVITLKEVKLYKALDEYGYGIEYLRAFERERITGKPFVLRNAVEYASIFTRIGQPQDAVNYLDSLTVPAGAASQDKIFYFYVYVIAAIKTGDLALADGKWREFRDIIDDARKSPIYSANSYMLYAAMIYVDCFAGKLGDLTRVQRAYDQTVAYMNTEHYKNHPLPNPDFEIILLLELKLLGRTDEFNALYPRVKQTVDTWDPLLRVQKQIVREDLEKVCRGELPL